MFEGFNDDRIDAGIATLRVRHGGHGPPVLLLHGHSRTHATWYRVAPLLSYRRTRTSAPTAVVSIGESGAA
jgi:haloacetate dehalogenase